MTLNNLSFDKKRIWQGRDLFLDSLIILEAIREYRKPACQDNTATYWLEHCNNHLLYVNPDSVKQEALKSLQSMAKDTVRHTVDLLSYQLLLN